MLLVRVESFPINLFSLMMERHGFMCEGDWKFVAETALINWKMCSASMLIMYIALDCIKPRSFSIYCPL